MFKIKLIALALLGALFVVGCGAKEEAAGTTGGTTVKQEPPKPANAMVGNWKLVVDPETMKGAPAGTKPPDVTVTFKDDGTFEANMMLGDTKTTASGKYKLEGKQLTMDTEMEDGKASTTKDETVTLADDMKSFDLPDSGGKGKMVKQ